MNTNLMFLSASVEWRTPIELYDRLCDEFDFTLDPCCTNESALCVKFFTKEDDGLAQSWDGERVFCNPPYGRGIGKWVQKASKAVGGVVVMLIPARTDTAYFHDYIYQQPNVEIRFLRGRVYFAKDGCDDRAPFPSMVVVFRPPVTPDHCTS